MLKPESEDFMNKFCVILPIKTGDIGKILGNRVFNCRVDDNDKVMILNEQNEVIKIIKSQECQFVNEYDFEIKESGYMWLK